MTTTVTAPTTNTLQVKANLATSTTNNIIALQHVTTNTPITGVSTSSGTTSYSAFASATASAGTSSTVGGVTFGIGATASANAKVTPLGASANASVQAEESVSYSPAAGVTVGAQVTAGANAMINVGVGPGGLHATGSVSAGITAGVTAGYQKDFGTGGKLDTSGGVSVGVVATASGTATLGKYVNADGKEVTGANIGDKYFAGAVASITGQATYENGGATVSYGGTLISPGSFGENANISPGYSDGSVEINVNLVGDIGIGGFGIQFGVGIPVGEFGTAYNAVASVGKDFGNIVANATPVALNAIEATLTAGLSGLENGVSSAVHAVTNGLTTVGNSIANEAESLGSTAKTAFQDGYNNVSNYLGSIGQGAENAGKGFVGGVESVGHFLGF